MGLMQSHESDLSELKQKHQGMSHIIRKVMHTS